MVPLGLRIGAGQGQLVDLAGIEGIGDIEHRHLGSLDLAVEIGVLTDPDQKVVADRVEVGGIARDLQLTGHLRSGRDR